MGANILVQTGGVCRLGYYGELDEQILKDLGYDVNFVNFSGTRISKPITLYDKFKQINPNETMLYLQIFHILFVFQRSHLTLQPRVKTLSI